MIGDEVILEMYPSRKKAHARLRELAREHRLHLSHSDLKAAREVTAVAKVLRDRWGSLGATR